MKKDISLKSGRLILASLWVVCALVVTTSFGKGTDVATGVEVRSEDKAAANSELEVLRETGEPATVNKLVDANSLNLPEDTTPTFTVERISITGNSLIPTEKLLRKLPAVYNAGKDPVSRSGGDRRYDFRAIRDVIQNPGQARDISSRTIQGFTQYLLSRYQKKHYGGIYVRVAPDTILPGGKLQDNTLAIEVIEMPVSYVTTTYYDIERNERDKGYLKKDVFEKWSPVVKGEMINQKKLDNFINLLNLDPDRYVSATVSQGLEPGSIAVGYDIYEINPWHYFLQVDNSGTDERQWNPKAGFINTNLTGRDDKLTTVVQAPLDQTARDNYSIYASYDVPLWTPSLRMVLFGTRSEYEISQSDIGFLGTGYAYGGQLRWNAFQKKDWFLDLTTSLSTEKSKTTTNLFPQFLGSEVYMNLWGTGIDLHRRSDMASTSFVVDRTQSIGGSHQYHFWDAGTGTGARRNTDRHFTILTFSANHSRFLDPGKVQRLLGSFKYIRPNERLVPSKMTAFGGMYSVRGYQENRIVADGGILGSIQYEYDLVRKGAPSQAGLNATEDKNKWTLQKLAPLVFFDYGRAKMKDHVAGERGTEELSSLGLGMIVEYGENLSAGIYYGYALQSAGPTDAGDGRINVGVTMRF